jgi:ABC-type amino acid transport substrate-binding protein
MVIAGTPFTDVVNLQGQQVAVVEGSESADVLLGTGRDLGVSFAVLPMPSLETAMAALEGGQVVAIAGERADMLGPSYASPGLFVLPLRLTHVPLALALPPGDSAFRDLVNLTLQAMKGNGEFDALYAAWFDDAPPPMETWPGAPYLPLGRQVTASP